MAFRPALMLGVFSALLAGSSLNLATGTSIQVSSKVASKVRRSRGRLAPSNTIEISADGRTESQEDHVRMRQGSGLGATAPQDVDPAEIQTSHIRKADGQKPMWNFVDLQPLMKRKKAPSLMETGRARGQPVDDVNVLIGTGAHGHTFPGATTPWGAVQATPWTHDQSIEAWDSQSGFHDDAPKPRFLGMAHSALSGAGAGELGELRLLPVLTASGEMRLERDSVEASPGSFAAAVGPEGDSAAIGIKSSATPHGAIHQFTFPDPSFTTHQSIKVLLSPPENAVYGGFRLIEHSQRVTSDRRIEGCSKGLVSAFGDALSLLCFVVDFGQAFQPPSAEDLQKADVAFDFPLENGPNSNQPILVRVATSRTDIEHARAAFVEEVEGKSFEDILAGARASWEKALGVVKVDIDPPARKRAFYTALYHSMVAPNLISDSDGSYRLQDKWKDDMPLRHASPEDGQYATFSFWDTYRALHPLINLIHPEQSRKFGKSLMAFEDAWGYIPGAWQLLASPAAMMEGDGGSIVLGTMARLNIVDEKEAFAVLNRTRRKAVDERKFLMNLGYIPRSETHSVSKALEQAKADSCVSNVARDLGHHDEADFFDGRAKGVHKYWNPKRSLFVPFNGRSAVEDTDDENTESSGYTEGTALQYSWSAESDVPNMAKLRGGSNKLACDLDYFFEKAPSQSGKIDMSGSMHGMSQGNEPTMHVPYLYAAVGYPSKTQSVVDRIVKALYSDKPNGLPGNDDLGAQSAWLVFSLLGFYPVNPCSGEYVLGRPFVNEAELAVSGGSLKIKVHEQADDHMYIQRATWQGQELDLAKLTLKHDSLTSGGLLEVWMSDKPAGPTEACP